LRSRLIVYSFLPNLLVWFHHFGSLSPRLTARTIEEINSPCWGGRIPGNSRYSLRSSARPGVQSWQSDVRTGLGPLDDPHDLSCQNSFEIRRTLGPTMNGSENWKPSVIVSAEASKPFRAAEVNVMAFVRSFGGGTVRVGRYSK
jgi:hypothetical protein